MKNRPELSALLRNLRGGAPNVMKAFAGIAQAVTVSKALDAKTNELIAFGISVAVRCDVCIAFHAKAAAEQGATKDEVSETLGMVIYMGVGPSAMYASHALEASHSSKPMWQRSQRIPPWRAPSVYKLREVL